MAAQREANAKSRAPLAPPLRSPRHGSPSENKLGGDLVLARGNKLTAGLYVSATCTNMARLARTYLAITRVVSRMIALEYKPSSAGAGSMVRNTYRIRSEIPDPVPSRRRYEREGGAIREGRARRNDGARDGKAALELAKAERGWGCACRLHADASKICKKKKQRSVSTLHEKRQDTYREHPPTTSMRPAELVMSSVRAHTLVERATADLACRRRLISGLVRVRAVLQEPGREKYRRQESAAAAAEKR